MADKNAQDVSAEVETTETQQPASEQKTNSFVAFWKNLGGKVKGVFGGWSNKSPRHVEADLVLNQQQQLSTGEKVKRALKAQSGWLFVAPALLLMLLFTFYPIVSAFINAFKQDLDLTGNYSGWGFDNFVHVFKGDTGTGGATFVQCLINTLVFTLVSVPLSTLIALLISVALNSIKAVQKAYQTILFLPYLTNSLAMGAVFATFFTLVNSGSGTNVGLINQFLGLFGIPPTDWMGIGAPVWELGDAVKIYWTKYLVVIIYEIWSGLPFKILILFSALQSVNKQYYDAARVDGAKRSTILWKITTPMIMPQISYLLVTGIMGGMKQYTAVVGLFGSKMGLQFEVGTMVGYVYQYIEGGSPKYGYAYAASLLLFAIIMVITFINNKITGKRSH